MNDHAEEERKEMHRKMQDRYTELQSPYICEWHRGEWLDIKLREKYDRRERQLWKAIALICGAFAVIFAFAASDYFSIKLGMAPIFFR